MNLKQSFKAMRKMPMFPVMPLLPMAVAATLLGVTLSSHRRLKRLEQRLKD